MKQIKKGLSILLLIFLLAGSLAGCRSNEEKKFESLEDLKQAKIGVMTGSSQVAAAQEKFPDSQLMCFNRSEDLVIALQQGKIDTFLADNNVFVGMQWENIFLDCIDEPLYPISNALILAKEGYDENLLRQINEFVARSKADGTLEKMEGKWLNNVEPQEHPDYSSLPNKNGTLKIALSDSMKPLSYQKGDHYTGYEVEFLTLFAKEYGYVLEPVGMSFEALIPSVMSGKCDIGACGITITPERVESVTFADPHFETYCVAVIRNDATGNAESETVENIKNGTIAIMSGTIWDSVAQKELPNAELNYFTSTSDTILALEQGKVDGILGPETFYATARWEKVPVEVMYETEKTIASGFMLPKDSYDEELLRQLNEFIAQSEKDGTIDALTEKWISNEEPTQHPDYHSLLGENGTLKIAVDNTAKPMVYQKNDTFTGFDIELLTKFAREYGYSLDLVGMSFDALIASVSSEKCDVGACGIAITPERQESVTFTEPYLELGGVLLVVQNTVSETGTNFIDDLAEDFQKTFIREDRWKLILEGVWVTVLISICAVIAGTAVGFSLYMLSRVDVSLIRKFARKIVKIYSRLIEGTPVVVILMILFYVVFGKVRDMSGILVAIIGFMLIFGAFVYRHMNVSVGSVDNGQIEAAYALGYTKNKAFFRIILPQAMDIFLPSYCSQAVELVKATAVVGYIAVNDLTKMGDIIRSNTYEAFFPLIATALIYFLLTWVLSLLLKLVKRHFEPKRRKQEEILKGIKTI